MKFFKDFFKGIAIGAGAILPGISSGVLCVIFGIYETLLNCVLNFFKNIKQNFKILFPIACGSFVGIILFGNILKYLFFAYPIQIKFIFIGLILGSIPALIKTNSSKHKFKPYYFIFTCIALFIGIYCVFLENNFSSNSSVSEYSFLFLLFSGILMSAGVIIPGVSSTLILMLLGIYTPYLDSVSCLYLPFLFPLSIGLLIGSILFMKITKFLLDRFYPQTFFTIIGFTIGSIFVLYPRILF